MKVQPWCSKVHPPASGLLQRTPVLPAALAQQRTSPTRRGLVQVQGFFGFKDNNEEHAEDQKPRRFTRRARAHRRDAATSSHQHHDFQQCTDDLVELCVGGKTMVTARSTLLQVPGSVLHEMFSSRDNPSLPRSSKGEVFLDYEPHMFGLVLRFLREAKMSHGVPDPSLSTFQPEDRAHLMLMLKHLRLLPHLPPSSGTTPLSPSTSPSTDSSSSGGRAPTSHLLSPQQHMAHQGSAAHQGRAATQSQRHWGADTQQTKTSPMQAPALPVSAGMQEEGVAASPLDGRVKARTAGGGSGTGWASQHETVRLVPPPVPRPVSTSQLYYVQAQYEDRRGIKISVYTEADLMNLQSSEQFGIFCDATASEGQLSFTFVCRQEFDNMFVGITTRNHTDCKGSQVPSFGWKSRGSIYSGLDGVDEQWCPLPYAGASKSDRGMAGSGNGQPLWRRGDSVELIVSLGDTINQPRMVLKVNGQQLDHIAYLPPLHNWSWYMALYMGTDTSSVAFASDSYAVFWGDYQVKRFL